MKKLIWKRCGEKPLSMGCQATQRNSSVSICSNANRISLSLRILVVGKEKYDWNISASILKFWHLVIVKVEPELISDCLSKVLPFLFALLALMVEQRFCKPKVVGSSPARSSYLGAHVPRLAMDLCKVCGRVRFSSFPQVG